MRIRMILTLSILALASMLLVAQDAEPTLDPFPAPTNLEIIVAEQVFEGGRMFYLSPNDRIWVMYNGETDEAGTWEVFENTWTEGLELEQSDAIVPPDGLNEPIRGFGKLWRVNEDVRSQLGWALTAELGHLTQYAFIAGEAEGGQDPDDVPGTHIIRSTFGSDVFFNEADFTWTIERQAPITNLEDLVGPIDLPPLVTPEPTVMPEIEAEVTEEAGN